MAEFCMEWTLAVLHWHSFNEEYQVGLSINTNSRTSTDTVVHYRPVDLCDHLAYYLLSHVLFHLHGSDQLS